MSEAATIMLVEVAIPGALLMVIFGCLGVALYVVACEVHKRNRNVDRQNRQLGR